MIDRSMGVIEKFTGTRPIGWLGPGLTQTYETPELLAAAGVKYIGDWVYDDEPTVIRTDKGPLVTLPYTVELNDIPMMIVQHHESEYSGSAAAATSSTGSGRRVRSARASWRWRSTPTFRASRTASGLSRRSTTTSIARGRGALERSRDLRLVHARSTRRCQHERPSDLIAPPTSSACRSGDPSPVAGGDRFPVRRIYCVGRNYVSHIREMKDADERDPPFFFQKPPTPSCTTGPHALPAGNGEPSSRGRTRPRRHRGPQHRGRSGAPACLGLRRRHRSHPPRPATGARDMRLALGSG